MDAATLERSRHLSLRLTRNRALSVHFNLGLRAYDEEDLGTLVRQREAVGMLPEGGVDSLEFMALDWRVKWLQDSRDEALAVAREITARYPADADGLLELGHILVDLERAEEALEVFDDGARRNPDDADLWYELGLVAERLERWDTRHEAFRKVWELEHELEPEHRLYLTEDRVVEIVTQTIARLPPMARAAMGNVAIIVEDYPEAWIVDDDIADPRILGLFDGPEHASENQLDTISEGPARIMIFRWNIERSCDSVEEAEEQVVITVLHEIGHYLGLDEDALHFLGLG